MAFSTLTAIDLIPEQSLATPGLFNHIFSQISDNVGTINQGGVPFNVASGSTWASIGLFANSNNSDYLRLKDSSGQRSTYRIGSAAGGTADGLNIWDESGNTMIASFSKQSIRFFQNVVGPVFDVGGSLTATLNAATFGTASQSTESRIQAAISAASNAGIARVYLPASMYPYSAGSVVFASTVQMVREGGDWAVNDVKAYGAAGNNVADDYIAIQRAISDAVAFGGTVNIPAGTYRYSSGLTIDGAVKIVGAGGPSDSNGVFGGVPQTLLNYSGSSVAITIVGSALQGLQNVHLADFMLTSVGSATGGILLGSGVNVGHSSIRNVTVSTFSRNNSYGFRFRNVITTILENNLTHECYDGYLFDAGAASTTITLINCHGYTSYRNALRVNQGAATTGNTFFRFIAESSNAEGIYLDGCRFANFYDLYCEDNNRVSGAATILIHGSGANPSSFINFYSPYLQSPVAGLSTITLGNAQGIVFFNPVVETTSPGWMTCTSETGYCEVRVQADSLLPANITGNALGRVYCTTAISTRRYAKTLTNGADIAGIAMTVGIWLLTDLTNNKSAIISLNGALNTASVLADPDLGFSGIVAAGRLCLYWGGSEFRIRNNTGVQINLLAVVLNADGI